MGVVEGYHNQRKHLEPQQSDVKDGGIFGKWQVQRNVSNSHLPT